MNFSFGSPWMLLALLLVPPVVVLMVRRRQRRAGVLFSATGRAAAATGGRVRTVWWLAALRALALTFLVVALARPRLGSEIRETTSSGIDIVLDVDLSGSMLALDLELDGQRATRLEVVKSVLKDFIDRRTSDRIGIVAFARQPYLVSPATLHHDWLQQNLARLQVGTVPMEGTSIGPPIGMATNRLRDLEDSKSRIIILLTDGEDQPPPPIEPMVFARAAKAFGIKVYTIAVGTGGRVPTYYPDGQGGIARFAGRPHIGYEVYPVDEEVLKAIATETGAQFYRARDTDELRNIYDQIDQLEKTEVKLQYRTEYEDIFYWPLAIGIAVLLLEQLLAATRLRTLP